MNAMNIGRVINLHCRHLSALDRAVAEELAYGGLSEETLERLDALADELEGKAGRRSGLLNRPIAGTRLIREWNGVEHSVTVRHSDFEYQGRPYRSLSAIAKHITGTQWNGLVFFGLKNTRKRS
jgi:hypothetical protein